MSIVQHLFAYAADFEKTFVDDDWSRLERRFAEDATYEVQNTSFACTVRGRDAILAALRKSIEGFDRRFDDRQLAVTRGPVVEDDTVEIDWTATYVKADAPDYLLVGGSVARFDGDRIVYLCDRYPDGVSESAAAWIREHAPDFDPSYV